MVCNEANIYSISNYPDYITNAIKKKICLSHRPLYISSALTFRGIQYAKGMHLCFEKNEFGLYKICNINFMLINHNFTDIYFLGTVFSVFYNLTNGLLEKTSEENEPQYVCFSYDDLINIEPLFHCIFHGDVHIFHFKSAPFEIF